MSAAAAVVPSVANIKRPRIDNLAGILQDQFRAIANRVYAPVGYVMRIQLGASDDSAYFQDPVNAQIAPLTRRMGLSFEWDQTCYPRMVEMGARGSESYLFPDGVKALPMITDPRSRRLSPTDPVAPKIRQDLDYYASGTLLGRDGSEYYVLQPVEQIAVRIPTTIAILQGMSHPFNGTKVAMLFSKKKRHGVHWAFLVHGALRFV
jgi:hypothetical protein